MARVPDDKLDKVSRELLSEIDELKAFELRKRRSTRSSPEFHRLAAEIEQTSRHVFEHSATEEAMAREDSPIPEDRDSTTPGDGTRRHDD